MGSTIDWKSTKAVKFFREHPAAMAVYWIYCARKNSEGAAWPTLIGLAADTGWCKSECSEARDLLVAHGALEPIADYIRPEWRKLPDKEKSIRINLDHAEYYRVSGVWVQAEKTLPMLYENEQQGDDENPDVLYHRTTTASDNGQGSTELNTIKDSEHSSKDIAPKKSRSKSKSKSKTTEQSTPRPRNPYFDMVAKDYFGEELDSPAFKALGGRIGNHASWVSGNEIKVKLVNEQTNKTETVVIPPPSREVTSEVLSKIRKRYIAKGELEFLPLAILKFVVEVENELKATTAKEEASGNTFFADGENPENYQDFVWRG